MADQQPIKAPCPEKSAQAGGLRYHSDEMPGIRREKNGGGFRYRHSTGPLIRDKQLLERIKSLVIPPAWTEVWVCPNENGHLQATGRDDRGRKQHIYHPRWREIRNETKYNRLIDFAKTLPKIRKRVEKDLSLPGLGREKVLATIVQLLEVSCIRVGNDEYARNNNSYGLTTMKDRHVDISGSTIRFQFRGKSGKEHVVDVQDRRLAKIVKACQDIPGQELFQYFDEKDQRQDVQSGDVNDYLREITGRDFSAKDFRTWSGTVLAALALLKVGPADSEDQARKNLVTAIKAVAQCLGNTPAICRKCYIHPAILGAYMAGSLIEKLNGKAEKPRASSSKGLRPEEVAVLNLVKERNGKGVTSASPKK